MTYEDIKERLKKAGIKATPQRILIYESLVALMNHPRAEMIFNRVKSRNPSISLATVYKTLDTFANAGLAVKMASAEGSFRYDHDCSDHDHIYCIDSKEIIDYHDSELKDILKTYFSKKHLKGVVIKDIRLQIVAEKIMPI